MQIAVGASEVVGALAGRQERCRRPTRSCVKAGLQLGHVEPAFDDGTKAIVDHQAPDPDSKVAKGTGVDIFIEAATAKTATTTETTTETTGTETTGTTGTETTGTGGTETTGTGGSTSGTPTAMPALAGLTAGAAINKLGSGVKTEQVEVYDLEKKPGEVVERRARGGDEAQARPEGDAHGFEGAATADRLHERGQDPVPGRRRQACSRRSATMACSTANRPGTTRATCSPISTTTPPTTPPASGSSTRPSRRPDVS